MTTYINSDRSKSTNHGQLRKSSTCLEVQHSKRERHLAMSLLVYYGRNRVPQQKSVGLGHEYMKQCHSLLWLTGSHSKDV